MMTGFKEIAKLPQLPTKIDLVAKCERCSTKFSVNSITLENYDSLQNMIQCPKCGVKYDFDIVKNEWFSDRPLTIIHQEPTPQEKIREVTNTKDKLIQLLNGLKTIQDEIKTLHETDHHNSSESLELFEGIILFTLDEKLTKDSIVDIDFNEIIKETMNDFEQHMEDQAIAIRDEDDELEELREQLREEDSN